MNLWQLILFLGTTFPHWTTAAPVANVTYDLFNGVLTNVISSDTSSLNLSHLGIESIGANSLDGLEKIQSLDLSNNPIAELPPFIFSKLGNLKNLSLAYTKICSFNNTFVGLSNLELLDITSTWITYLKRGDLFGLTKKVKIMVSGKYTDSGRPLSSISTGIFKDPSLPVVASTKYSANEGTVMNPIREEDKPTLMYALKICTTDGIVESVEDAKWGDKVGNCTLQEEGKSECCGRRREMMIDTIDGIKGFKPKWYRVKDSFFNAINLHFNRIDNLSPELLNDLPPTITMINFAGNDLTAIKNNGVKNNNPISLLFTNNKISTIEDGALEKLNLVTLDLHLNHLMSTGFAKTLPVTITTLVLEYNKIVEVPLDSFHGLKNLEYLNMKYNQVQNIEPGTFRNLKNLTKIDFTGNEIGELKPGFFQGLDNLQAIGLAYNQIKKIPSDLFKEWNPPPTKFTLGLDFNIIKTIEGGAFSHMNLSQLWLRDNKFKDNSIGEGAFNQSHIFGIYLGSPELTKFDGEWFRDISGLERIELSSNSVEKIEMGSAKSMKNVTSLTLKSSKLEIRENGALFGLSTEKDMAISIDMRSLRVIEGGLFDDP